ncbi:hypothetical protein C1H46_028733 [Malus baccata]|uniref:Uncharacterized protein n=1 Tax=Malus baccata TaxID=106549 RepID=A0A540LGT4_MALBA|nr:hypothetical protein C1H46_028733 [Malus baccata]
MASNFGHETTSRNIENLYEDLLKCTSARELSAKALAALDTVSHYVRSSLDTLCTNEAYEEFKVALELSTEQRMIHSMITSLVKDLFLSLEGDMPKYVATEKELA